MMFVICFLSNPPMRVPIQDTSSNIFQWRSIRVHLLLCTYDAASARAEKLTKSRRMTRFHWLLTVILLRAVHGNDLVPRK